MKRRKAAQFLITPYQFIVGKGLLLLLRSSASPPVPHVNVGQKTINKLFLLFKNILAEGNPWLQWVKRCRNA